MKVFENVNEKNIDKFKNYVIELNFNNIFISYVAFEGMINEGIDDFSIW